MLKRILLLGVLMAGVVAVVPRVLTANDDEALAAVEAALAVDWLELRTVEMTETEDEPILTVYYVTRELDEIAYRAEMIEIFRLVGAADAPANMDIAIVPQIEMGEQTQGLEMATVSLRWVQQLAAGDVTRTDFIDELQISPLEHFRSEAQNPA